jgi:hypothetical protein
MAAEPSKPWIRKTEASPHLVRSLAREGVLSLFILTAALLVPLAADGLFAFFDKEKRQSIHDRAGRTLVVESEQGYHLDEKVPAAAPRNPRGRSY